MAQETYAEFEDFMGYSHGDGAFAAWCQEVDALSTHFLCMSFFEFESETHPMDAYEQSMKPEEFLKQMVISDAICSYGFDSIEALIANNIMWGSGY